MEIRKWNYGKYSSDNYGAHCMTFTVGGLTLYFSYNTVVAFRGRNGLKVRKNEWRSTTGKHLNWIDGGDKKARLDSEEFLKLLQAELDYHKLTV